MSYVTIKAHTSQDKQQIPLARLGSLNSAYFWLPPPLNFHGTQDKSDIWTVKQSFRYQISMSYFILFLSFWLKWLLHAHLLIKIRTSALHHQADTEILCSISLAGKQGHHFIKTKKILYQQVFLHINYKMQDIIP